MVRLIKKHLFPILIFSGVSLTSCENSFRNDYRDNSPTSGKLKVYYDEGLAPHVKNQAFTFESQYSRVHLELIHSTEDESVLALWRDSCEAIVISRLLNKKERALFASRQYDPKYSLVAQSGVCFVVSQESTVKDISMVDLKGLLSEGKAISDSAGNEVNPRILIDRDNSSVMRYLSDSLLGTAQFGSNCSSASSTPETISYIAGNRNSIGIIDFAWLSDRDDPFFKAYASKVRFVGIRQGKRVSYPSQSSFKTGEYPLTRNVYVMRKTGEFTLAKGFESFVAGPKGQLTFLKQGLMPARQAERLIEVNMAIPEEAENLIK